MAASNFINIGDDCSSVNNPLGFLNYHHFLNYFIDFQKNYFLLEPKLALNVASFASFCSYLEGLYKDFDPFENLSRLSLSLRQHKPPPRKKFGSKYG